MNVYIIPCVAGTLIYSALFGPPLNHSCLFIVLVFHLFCLSNVFFLSSFCLSDVFFLSCFLSIYRFLSYMFANSSFKCVFSSSVNFFFRSSFEFVHFLCRILFLLVVCLFVLNFLNLDSKLSTICLPFICCLSVHISVGLFVF
jgi:hypothetical protein